MCREMWASSNGDWWDLAHATCCKNFSSYIYGQGSVVIDWIIVVQHQFKGSDISSVAFWMVWAESFVNSLSQNLVPVASWGKYFTAFNPAYLIFSRCWEHIARDATILRMAHVCLMNINVLTPYELERSTMFFIPLISYFMYIYTSHLKRKNPFIMNQSPLLNLVGMPPNCCRSPGCLTFNSWFNQLGRDKFRS